MQASFPFTENGMGGHRVTLMGGLKVMKKTFPVEATKLAQEWNDGRRVKRRERKVEESHWMIKMDGGRVEEEVGSM